MVFLEEKAKLQILEDWVTLEAFMGDDDKFRTTMCSFAVLFNFDFTVLDKIHDLLVLRYNIVKLQRKMYHI